MGAGEFGSALREARRERGLSLRALQTLVRYDFTYLGQVERGEKPGSPALAAVCDEALTAGGTLIGLFAAGGSGPVGASGEDIETDCPERRNVPDNVSGQPVGGCSEVNAESVAAIPLNSGGEGRGCCVTLADLRRLYHGRYSVGDLVKNVSRCARETSRRLLEARGSGCRRRLLVHHADASLLAGRLALFDTWSPVEARGRLTAAWETAAEAGDDALVAGAFGHLAFVPARHGMPGAGEVYLRLARRHAERSGVPALVSWVAAVEAELLGPLRPDGGVRALDLAVEALDRAPEAPVPTWFDFYSPARLEGFRGQVLLAAGDGPAARDALTRALAELDPDAVKQRAVLLADLAATGFVDPSPDVAQIAAEATAAAAELGRTRYRAAAERLTSLRARLEPWSRTAPVVELDDALAEAARSVG